MGKIYKLDLHIHTCLSPCGELEMTPGKIVKDARKKGLDGIGICDHNASENIPALIKTGKREDMRIICGIEVTSKEEVHILGLFSTYEELCDLQKIVYENLNGENDPEVFGYQVVMDENDEPAAINDELLIGATSLSVREIVDLIHRFCGLAVASHVDREGFGIIGQLGFIPPDCALDALEISPKISRKCALETLSVKGFPLITSSDAHRLDEIGKSYTSFLMEDVTLEEIKKAFQGREGRMIIE